MNQIFIDGKRRTLCTGSLTEQIEIKLRSLTAPTGNSVDFSEAFTAVKTVWAMVKTTRGSEMFDGTNLTNAYTHEFYIRFLPDTVFGTSGRLSTQEWVKYKDRYYTIQDVENFEERSEWMIMRCAERGATSKAVNYA